jgi:hypothetical protein
MIASTELETILKAQSRQLQRLATYAAARELRDVLKAIPEQSRLERWGMKVYSQSDEDGIIAEIFRRIGISPESGIFIEFGVENGLENNTHYLLRQGYSGVWLEHADRSVKWIRRLFVDYLASGQLQLAEELVTRERIDDRLGTLADGRPVSVLSIDVDGNDYWLWERVHAIKPAVVVIEYNGTFPPPLSIVQEYRPDPPLKVRTDDFGASLTALTKLGLNKGYRLVGCNITGVNAFLVREDLVTDERFPYERTAESLYQPLRKNLVLDCFINGYLPAVGRWVTV